MFKGLIWTHFRIGQGNLDVMYQKLPNIVIILKLFADRIFCYFHNSLGIFSVTRLNAFKAGKIFQTLGISKGHIELSKHDQSSTIASLIIDYSLPGHKAGKQHFST